MSTTPLHDVHVGLGAVMTDFAGWSMPLRYGSELAEHHAVRNAAGLFDLSHMGEIVVTGAAAAEVVDRSFVTRLSAVDVGRARYTMLCRPDGGVIDDVIVYRRAEQDFLVVANAANRARVFDELVDRSDGQAEVADRSDDMALVAVQGPRAAAIMTSLGVPDVDAVRYYAGQDARAADVPVFLARTGYTGEDGFELFCAPGAAVDLWHAITEAGADVGLVPAGLACRDTLRLEAGMPLYGNELSEDRTPFDAGLGRIVQLDGHDFVGAEALARRAEQEGEVRLVGLVAEGRRAPRAGNRVLGTDGEPVGVVTSGALSPTLGHPIAMAYLATGRPTVGESLVADVRGTDVPVWIADLPFHRRAR